MQSDFTTSAMKSAMLTFQWFLNLVKLVVIKVCWLLIETAAYILKTGFVGYKLGGILDAALGASNSVDPIFENVKQIFSALIQSINNAIPGIPDVLKPLIHVSLFSIVQSALEKIYEKVPTLFEWMLNDNEFDSHMKQHVEDIFTVTLNPEILDCTSEHVPCNSDVSNAVNEVKNELDLGKLISLAQRQHKIKTWRHRANKKMSSEYSRKELVKICMKYKREHGLSCGGKGVTKTELAKSMKPYLDVIEMMQV